MIPCFLKVFNSGLQNQVRRRAVDEDSVGGPDEKPAHLEQAVQHVQAQVGEDLGEQKLSALHKFSNFRVGSDRSRMPQGFGNYALKPRKMEEKPRKQRHLSCYKDVCWGLGQKSCSRFSKRRCLRGDDCRGIAIAYPSRVAKPTGIVSWTSRVSEN